MSLFSYEAMDSTGKMIGDRIEADNIKDAFEALHKLGYAPMIVRPIMQTFIFEAMDATGLEIRDEIQSETVEEAQATIRQLGYFVTKITTKQEPKEDAVKIDQLRKKYRKLLSPNIFKLLLNQYGLAVVAFIVGTIFGLLLRGALQ